MLALAAEIVGDGPAQGGIGDVVRRMHQHRGVAAGELVLSLRAGLDALEAAPDREIDGLIVADLEMQERVVLVAAPVPAIERDVADEVDRTGDVASLALGHHQQDALGHTLAEQAEERAVEIGPAPFARAGIRVELVERIPMGRGQVGPGDVLDGDALAQGVAALAPDRLALARGQGTEEILEPCIALVGPVKLLVDPLEHTDLPGLLPLALAHEGDMDRGGLGLRPEGTQSGDEGRGGLVHILPRGDQEARAGDGRERYADLELGIIGAAGPLIGVGPAMVEHVLALAVDFR